MNFPWKVILTCLLLGFHFSRGNVYNRHENVKRSVNDTLNAWGISPAFIKSILTPIADLADKIDVDIPVISNYRTDTKDD